MRLAAGQPTRPYKLKDVTVGNTLLLEIGSLNFDNQPEAPTSMRYRIDNLSNLVVITDWTSIPAPGITTTLPISAATNVMSYQGTDQQTNQVTIEATYADGTKALWVGAYRLNQVFNVMGSGVVP